MANIGALIIRIGFWGPLYYTYNKEPLKIGFGTSFGPSYRTRRNRASPYPGIFPSATLSSGLKELVRLTAIRKDVDNGWESCSKIGLGFRV